MASKLDWRSGGVMTRAAKCKSRVRHDVQRVADVLGVVHKICFSRQKFK
jgi:hypothetical protein